MAPDNFVFMCDGRFPAPSTCYWAAPTFSLGNAAAAWWALARPNFNTPSFAPYHTHSPSFRTLGSEFGFRVAALWAPVAADLGVGAPQDRRPSPLNRPRRIFLLLWSMAVRRPKNFLRPFWILRWAPRAPRWALRAQTSALAIPSRVLQLIFSLSGHRTHPTRVMT